MASQKKTETREEILQALHEARERVALLEAVLARLDALLGTGVEREIQERQGSGQKSMMQYLEMIEPGEDISDYIGREGDDESRPRLGDDAPAEVRPNKRPPVNPLVRQLVETHPNDGLSFHSAVAQPQTVRPSADAEDAQNDALAEEGAESRQSRAILPSQRMTDQCYALFNAMGDGFILFEYIAEQAEKTPAHTAEDFVPVAFNTSFCRFFSLEHSAVSGRRLSEFMGEGAEQWADCLGRVLVHGSPVEQRISIAGRCFATSAYSPEESRVICFVRDVTEQPQAVQESSRNEPSRAGRPSRKK